MCAKTVIQSCHVLSTITSVKSQNISNMFLKCISVEITLKRNRHKMSDRVLIFVSTRRWSSPAHLLSCVVAVHYLVINHVRGHIKNLDDKNLHLIPHLHSQFNLNTERT